MHRVRPVPALRYAIPADRDLSARIAPPYDVLDETAKTRLLERDPKNIVAVDLPHLPPKTVGPDATYEAAADRLAALIEEGTLVRRQQPAYYVYHQHFEVAGRAFTRRALFANVAVQPFGDDPGGAGGVYPHEQTFSSPKEDRLKLMRTTAAQLSPIFGLYSDRDETVAGRIAGAVAGRKSDYHAVTDHDGVRHEVWEVTDPEAVAAIGEALEGAEIFIADGHHRYTTAMNYLEELEQAGPVAPDHPATGCLFALVAMEDPGMIVLPTHRVLGGMRGFSIEALEKAAGGRLELKPFEGPDLAALEAALPEHGPHAMGLYAPGESGPALWIATTAEADPLGEAFPDHDPAWRGLDVAIVQHLLVEAICEPAFGAGEPLTWKFPHELEAVRQIAESADHQLGIVLQAPPLASIRAVSEAGELMPQKSTFFYPKLATGLVMNPLGERRPAGG